MQALLSVGSFLLCGFCGVCVLVASSSCCSCVACCFCSERSLDRRCATAGQKCVRDGHNSCSFIPVFLLSHIIYSSIFSHFSSSHDWERQDRKVWQEQEGFGGRIPGRPSGILEPLHFLTVVHQLIPSHLGAHILCRVCVMRALSCVRAS